jgi:hypothetical protein
VCKPNINNPVLFVKVKNEPTPVDETEAFNSQSVAYSNEKSQREQDNQQPIQNNLNLSAIAENIDSCLVVC